MVKSRCLTRFGLPTLLVLLPTPGPGTALAAVAPALVGNAGMVASDHQLASKAGAQILRRGGNAVDAACATAFALGVVQPAGSGLGGGGFMLIKLPTKDDAIVLDFREAAPAGSRSDMYTRPGVPRHASRYGGLAVGIPGEVLGCAQAVKRFGKLRLAKVLAPAIRLARRGFPVGRHLARYVAHQRDTIRESKGLKKALLRGADDKPVAEGRRMRRPRLARSLAAIAARGPKVFYRGWIARDLVETVQRAGGILTLGDLADYEVKERRPIITTFRGHQIFSMPPPSSGGITLVAALNILKRWPLKKMGHNSSAYLHKLAEALKHTMSDRTRYLGDADFVKVPIARLTSKTYASAMAQRIGHKVLPLKRYGSPEPPRAPSRDGGTSHLSVVDKRGMSVALTTTINTPFGSRIVGRKSGIILNNQMDDFAAKPGKANFFGLVQGKQNAVAPGKRPLSSMSPTIVTRDGKISLVLGGSGGPLIITSTLQVLLNVIEFDFDLRDAVSRSRIHHQWLPNEMIVEKDLPYDVRAALSKRGHRVTIIKRPFAAVQAVQVRAKGDGGDGLTFSGASDPRKMGAPVAP